jgi:hypothetical protein
MKNAHKEESDMLLEDDIAQFFEEDLEHQEFNEIMEF